MNIAIVGSGHDTWPLAPFDDPTWKIWGFSRRNYNKLPRCDLWFELHKPSAFHQYNKDIPPYVPWLLSRKERMTQPTFPKGLVLQRFGPYFLCHGQAPWIMAYAILQEPQRISLYGIEGIEPYHGQRSEIQHFSQVARDLGIEVEAPGSTVLEPRKLYAFS